MVEMKKNNEKRKLFQGRVISDKMEKTIVVEYSRTYMNLKVHKVVEAKKKYKVHDAEKKAKVGDMVEFYEGRPISKTKYMYLVRVVSVDKN